MTTKELYEELNYVNHSREKRLYYVNLVFGIRDLIPKLLDIRFKVNDKISCRAARVFEFICGEQLDACTSYLNQFTTNMHRVHLDFAVRPAAKVCEYLIKAYYSKEKCEIQTILLPKHKERIIEACF